VPIDPHHQEEIAAALGAYNATGRRQLPMADVMRLLTVMFADGDVCRRNLDSLVAEGFALVALIRLLRALIETSLISKERGKSRTPNTYHLLLLQPRRQP
jgi:hypothetical protein